MSLDYHLIHQARSFVTGATTHRVGAWILAYEMYPPGCSRSIRLEGLLRTFVNDQCRLRYTRARSETQRAVLSDLLMKSAALDRRIEKLLSSMSD